MAGFRPPLRDLPPGKPFRARADGTFVLLYGAFVENNYWKWAMPVTKGYISFHNGRSSGLERCGRELRRRLPDLVPHLIAPRSGFSREGNHRRRRICLRQALQRVAQLIVREPVALGGNQKKVAA